MLPTPFPVARYRFDCTVETTLHLPEYAGSALRGAFGHALRHTACMTRQKDCKACPLYRTCPYPAIFQPPVPATHVLQKFSEIPVPFVVEPPDWGERTYQPGETLQFHMVLIGKALAQLPLVIYAWQRALQHGLGRSEGTARLERVRHLGEAGESDVYLAQTGELTAHTGHITLQPEESPVGTVTLEFSTPLRVQHQGRPQGPDTITTRDLLVGLIRRTALLSEFHLGRALELDFKHLAEQADQLQSSSHLVWRDWTRYSSRQKQEMALGGCVGTWTMNGHLDDYMPFLKLGQWLHIGKNASFGLGAYRFDGDPGTLSPPEIGHHENPPHHSLESCLST